MGKYVLYDSIHVKKGEKKTVVTTRQEHESWLQEEHDGTFRILDTVPTLIWAVANIAVHMCKNKEVFASVAYVMYQTVIFKELKLKQIK